MSREPAHPGGKEAGRADLRDTGNHWETVKTRGGVRVGGWRREERRGQEGDGVKSEIPVLSIQYILVINSLIISYDFSVNISSRLMKSVILLLLIVMPIILLLIYYKIFLFFTVQHDT